jgi:hypothetical protein
MNAKKLNVSALRNVLLLEAIAFGRRSGVPIDFASRSLSVLGPIRHACGRQLLPRERAMNRLTRLLSLSAPLGTERAMLSVPARRLHRAPHIFTFGQQFPPRRCEKVRLESSAFVHSCGDPRVQSSWRTSGASAAIALSRL